MSTYKTFKTNSKKEVEGIVLDIGESGKFKIARAGGSNKKYDAELAKRTKNVRRTMDNDMALAISRDVICETCLLGWEGVTDEEGKELPFSFVNAKKLLKDLPDLFWTIRDAVEDARLFRDADAEADSKNS